MTENITNIINYDALTRIRHSGSLSLMPKVNSLVSLEIIERLEHGAKVLINGKLFIAIIDEHVPLKEELLAWVNSVKKFSLTLNLEKQLNNNSDKLLKEILLKLKINNSEKNKSVLTKIIKEKKPVIKSRVNQLFNLIDELSLELSDIQLILLINLVWNNTRNENDFAKDIIENLFDESFEEVSKHVLEKTKELLFSDISPFIIKDINNKIIYDEGNNNTVALINKSESLIEIIKSLNNYLELNNRSLYKPQIEEFIRYGSKYVLQKKILQEYNYYLDFVAAEHNGEIVLIFVEIKKSITASNEPTYTLEFKYNDSPVELNGLMKKYFLMGNISTGISDEEVLKNKIENFRKNLWLKWNINSDITLNNKNQNSKFNKIEQLEINKLVS